MPKQNETTGWPKEGEVWRNEAGARRYVRDVDDDGYCVTYSRPAPAHPDFITVLMNDWLTWVEATHAVRIRKATASTPKDWAYVT